jgi:LmbE family N-acetylglucosaminyl deacetylase
MRYIYFSPHLDDAILSAGGLISDQTMAGIPVEIWTFMSGVPDGDQLTDFAQLMHKTWGTTTAKQTIQIRREEDRRAASRVGAKAVHFDFLDCIYRRGKNGKALYESEVFITPHTEDADLPAQIAQTMVAWLKPDDVIVSQLAIGGHVDHILVRKAAEMLKRKLVFAMDIPYLLDHPDDLSPKTAGMKNSLQPVSEAGLVTWLKAIEDYVSQLGSLFSSIDSMRERMRVYWSERRGVQFWSI